MENPFFQGLEINRDVRKLGHAIRRLTRIVGPRKRASVSANLRQTPQLKMSCNVIGAVLISRLVILALSSANEFSAVVLVPDPDVDD